MSDDLPLEHVRRPALPWRDLALTECGLPVEGGTWSRKERPRVDTHPTQTKLRWEVA
jgi:hypothetical protein